MPKVAVGVFSRHLFKHIIDTYKCKEVGYISCANFERNIYILTYKDTPITFFMAGVGSPLVASDIEELSAQGVKLFIIFGNCGVLDPTIPDKSIIIPVKGFREEGTSYHYIPSSTTIKINPKYVCIFTELAKRNNFTYYKGITWTTDAFYRETSDKVNYYKTRG